MTGSGLKGMKGQYWGASEGSRVIFEASLACS